LHALGTPAAVATFLGCVAGGAVSFRVSRVWTFDARSAGFGPQLLRFALVWATSALFNSAGVPLLLQWWGSFPVAWALVRSAVYLGWNYPLSRWFVFASKPSGALNAR
jgi:putative flippase GtrA